jgi:hypothetical protein
MDSTSNQSWIWSCHFESSFTLSLNWFTEISVEKFPYLYIYIMCVWLLSFVMLNIWLLIKVVSCCTCTIQYHSSIGMVSICWRTSLRLSQLHFWVREIVISTPTKIINRIVHRRWAKKETKNEEITFFEIFNF